MSGMTGTALENQGMRFVDFDPAETLIDRALEKMNRIFGESPSDSSASAEVRKTANGFEGRLQVRSAVGIFMADAIGEDPAKVIDVLVRKVRTQLRIWKRDRAFGLNS